MEFFRKMRGTTQSPPRVGLMEVFWSWVGAMLGLASVGFLHVHFLGMTGLPLMLGSFGATAVLVYGTPRSPLAQPRNVLGGHLLSAVVGVSAHLAVGQVPWLAGALAVATAIALMHLTKTLHPPGGATALIAVVGGDAVHNLGYMYAVVPAGLGAAVLVFVALIVNNIPGNRRYPEFWL